MSLMDLAQALQDTTFATAISSSGYVYPIIEGTHVLSLALAVGGILWVDLCLPGHKHSGIPAAGSPAPAAKKKVHRPTPGKAARILRKK